VKNCLVVVDDLIPHCPNLVAGANEAGYHYRNVNYQRDFTADVVADIALADEGHLSPLGGGPMVTRRGVEIGNIFKLGTRYTDALGCSFLDENGQSQSVVMGSYGIGVGRLLASIAEEHNDEYGLIWPITVAPYHLHLVNLSKKSDTAEQLFAQLTEAGVEVLFDDREASPGVKFNDADLIGLPLRLTVGDRSLKQGGVELKRRDGQKEMPLVPLDEVIATVQAEIAALFAEVEAGLVEVPFEA
jgi:prolyl-tRNA synthetase